MNTSLWVIAIVVVIVAVLVCVALWMKKRHGPGGKLGGDEDWDWNCPSGNWDAEDEEEVEEEDGGLGEGNIGGARTFRLLVREPWYGKMKEKEKTVIGRLQKGAFAKGRLKLKAGDPVVISRSRAKDDKAEYGKPYRYETTAAHVKEYDSLAKLLKGEGVDKVFPGSKSETAALAEFGKFYEGEDGPAVAIAVKPPTASALKQYA